MIARIPQRTKDDYGICVVGMVSCGCIAWIRRIFLDDSVAILPLTF